MSEDSTRTEGTEEQPEQILLVDDNPTNLQVLYETLDSGPNKGKYRLLVAKNGEGALTIANKAKPSLILLDIMMPGIDGYEVCQRLKKNPETQDIPVILLTAVASRVTSSTYTHRDMLESDAEDYMPKPVEPEELLNRIKDWL